MDSIIDALKAVGIIPAGLPAEIEIGIATVLAETAERVIAKHTADPTFGPKIAAWSQQALQAQGGTDADKAAASAALVQLMGS